ncbi:hypothetical protein [Rhizobium sp. S96]|nr:hypothetical protein [Rhizobium sp. S96]MDM9618776.1 hypothetical protein [Rhizobium sp. S96]
MHSARGAIAHILRVPCHTEILTYSLAPTIRMAVVFPTEKAANVAWIAP